MPLVFDTIILHDAGECSKLWATIMLTFTSVLGLLNVAALRHRRLKTRRPTDTADVFRLYRPIVQRCCNIGLLCAIDAISAVEKYGTIFYFVEKS